MNARKYVLMEQHLQGATTVHDLITHIVELEETIAEIQHGGLDSKKLRDIRHIYETQKAAGKNVIALSIGNFERLLEYAETHNATVMMGLDDDDDEIMLPMDEHLHQMLSSAASCPKCHRDIHAKDNTRNETYTCPHCHHAVTLTYG